MTMELPSHGSGRDGARFGRAPARTQDSRQFVDNTPGPIYDIPSDFKPPVPTLTDILDAAANNGTIVLKPPQLHADGHRAMFDRSTLVNTNDDDTVVSATSARRRRRPIVVAPTDRSPWIATTRELGPARYKPLHAITEMEYPQPGFTRAPRFLTHSQHGATHEISQAYMGTDSPGPKYNVRDNVPLDHIRSRSLSYSFGGSTSGEKDRLKYLLRDQMSPTSPSYRPHVGPASYSPHEKPTVSHQTRSSRQKRFPTQKNLNYISAKHNDVRKGLFSPGPAYFPKSQTIELHVSKTKKKPITPFAVPAGDFQLSRHARHRYIDRSLWLSWQVKRRHSTTSGHEPIPIEICDMTRLVSPGPASHQLPTGVGPSDFFVAESLDMNSPHNRRASPRSLRIAQHTITRSPSPPVSMSSVTTPSLSPSTRSTIRSVSGSLSARQHRHHHGISHRAPVSASSSSIIDTEQRPFTSVSSSRPAIAVAKNIRNEVLAASQQINSEPTISTCVPPLSSPAHSTSLSLSMISTPAMTSTMSAPATAPANIYGMSSSTEHHSGKRVLISPRQPTSARRHIDIHHDDSDD